MVTIEDEMSKVLGGAGEWSGVGRRAPHPVPLPIRRGEGGTDGCVRESVAARGASSATWVVGGGTCDKLGGGEVGGAIAVKDSENVVEILFGGRLVQRDANGLVVELTEVNPIRFRDSHNFSGGFGEKVDLKCIEVFRAD